MPFSCPSFSLCLFPFLLHWLHLRTCRENRPTWGTTWGFFKKHTVLSELFKEWSHKSQYFLGKQNQIVDGRTRHEVIWYNPNEEKLLRAHETYVNLGERSKFAVIRALLVPCDVIDFTVFFSCDLEVTNENARWWENKQLARTTNLGIDSRSPPPYRISSYLFTVIRFTWKQLT